MYHDYYRLRVDPFRLSPTGQLCFAHESYLQTRSHLQYALHKGEGIVLLTGDPGMGKTSLIKELTTELVNSRICLTNLTCSQLDAKDLLQFVARGMDIRFQTSNQVALREAIEAVLLDIHHRQKRQPVLVLDEAQTLSIDALEQVRLLTNLHWQDTPLLQVFLVGQRALRDHVLSPELEQLHQRIITSATLEPLLESDVQGYIEHRLKLAGWTNNPELSDDIFQPIHRYSLGVPRWINLICTRLLLHGTVEQLSSLGRNEIQQVLRELLAEDLLPQQVRSVFQVVPRVDQQ